MCLAAGFRLDPPLGSYSAPPDPLAVIRGTWRERVGNREGEGRGGHEGVGSDGKGREDRESGVRVRLG